MSNYLKTPWIQQPQGAVGIDWSNPITRGLTSAWFAGVEYVKTGHCSAPYGTKAYGKYGAAGKGNGSSTYRNLSSGAITGTEGFGPSPTTGITRLALIRAGATSSQYVISSSNTDSDRGVSFRINTTSVGLGLPFLGSVVNFTNAVVSGEYCSICITGKSGAITFFKNGTKVSTSTATCNSAVDGTSTLGSAFSGSSRIQFFDGELYLHLAFNRTLSDAEGKSLTENPWQIFQPLRRPIFVGLGDTPTGLNYTIVPSGSITLSNITDFIKTKVFSASGSFTLSGTAPLTFVGGSTTYTISPLGSITFNGSYTARITSVMPTSGSVTLSGTNKLLKTAVMLPSGSLTLSGDNFTVRTYVVAPNGSLTLSGTADLYMPGATVESTKLPMTGVGN